ALYKWFASDPSAVVSIGKSVDCSLEMSWDIAPGIGPRQAEIRLLRGRPYLFAVDNGIKVKKRNLRAGEKMRLYHGRMFRIGNTEFVYKERDI
ncbi:MAG: FHA domain-containing protein, partial [Bacteroidales bacterium]|nr:FHA domain-containing protein [Bacteroidales bacterium]